MAIRHWLKRIHKWLRIFLAGNRNSPAPTARILKRWYGEHCAVLQLERRTPGAKSTYRIVARHGDCDYLIALDYLPELRATILGEFDGTIIVLRPIDYPVDLATHRFAVFRLFRNGRNHLVGAWDVDLQGSASSTLREIAPQRASRAVALLLLRIRHKPPLNTWSKQVEQTNWTDLLQEKIRAELSNPSHCIKAVKYVQ